MNFLVSLFRLVRDLIAKVNFYFSKTDTIPIVYDIIRVT